jgi:hypothetical protein
VQVSTLSEKGNRVVNKLELLSLVSARREIDEAVSTLRVARPLDVNVTSSHFIPSWPILLHLENMS